MEFSLFWKIVQVLLICGFPALAMYGAKKTKVINWMGPVVLCYLFGILLVNAFRFPVHKSLSTQFTEITVVLAIPLLLFSTNIIRWLRLAKKTALSVAIAFGSVLICSSVGAFILASRVEEASKVAGMLVGVYTGGTPNMSAIGMALSVKEETFIIVNAIDVIMGAIYLVFLMSIAKKFLGKFMPAFQTSGNQSEESLPGETDKKATIPHIIASLGLSALYVGMSIGLSLLISGEMQIAIVILTITTLGIISSFIKPIRSIPGTYDTGQYILLMFCVAIGTLADVKDLLVASPNIFLFVGIAMFGAILLHYILGTLFRIDVDTVIITSTGAIYGPAFIGPIAGVLKNREAVVSGLTAGLLGYALGNYLGIGLSVLLKSVL